MKKFWKNVEVIESSENLFQILLDKKHLKTPLKKDLIFSNYKIAKETALEWDFDEEEINTDNMIFYGLMSTAIDKIHSDKRSYVNNIVSFINTDLICYRAEGPNDLVELQNNLWNPIISYIGENIGATLDTFIGVMPSKQSEETFIKVENLINSISVLYRLTNLTGSIFISLSILKGHVAKDKAFKLSFLDELWQVANWGVEEEAAIKRSKILLELNRIISFIEIIR